MTNVSFQDIIQIIIGIVTLSGVIIGMASYLYDAFTRINKIFNMCTIIQEQLETNGGTSLRDSINRIERNQSEFKLLQFTLYTYWDTVFQSPMVISDTNGYYIWANKAYLVMLDKTLNEVVGTNWESYIHQDDRDDIIKRWYESCIDGRSFEGSFRMIHSDGTTINVKCKTRANKEYGYVGFFSKVE